ncbi:MAG: tetratricopeptide repeat protein [Leptolyngbya sp.]|nr:tetratricopeptide repeat protein [Leptolyngbya sp.]
MVIRSVPGVLLLALWLGIGAIAPPLALASEQLERQLDIRPGNATQGQARDVADQLLRLGSQERLAGNYEQAIAAWYRAIDIYNALGDMTTAGIAYDYIGLTYAQLSRYGDAEDTLRRRLAVAQDNRDFLGQVRGWTNLGTVFIQRGQLTTAQEAFQTALEVAASIEDDGGIGLSLSNLGLVAQLQGHLNDARKYYEAATGYRLRAGDLVGEANSSNNLGAVYYRLGEEGSALGAYLVARDAAQRSGDLANWLRALDGLIEIYRNREEVPQVQRFVEERVALTSTADTSPFQRLLTLTRLGEYYTLAGDRAAAIQAYEQALVVARQLEENSREAVLINRLQALRQQ